MQQVPIYEFDGVVPVVDPTAFVHPTAVLIGDVIVGAGCYVAPFASLRGDFGRVTVGAGSNVQDGCVLHCFPGADCILEPESHIGHGAILHGCHVHSGAMIGMQAVVMDGVTVGALSLVGACAFVPANFVVPERTLVAGSPAKVIRPLDDVTLEWKRNGLKVYQDLAQRSLETMKVTTALPAVEADRRRVSTGRDVSQPLADVRSREAEKT